jgi:hypothetical protein
VPHLRDSLIVAKVVAVASEIEPDFTPASKPRRKAIPLCRRLERSPKDEATDLLPLLCPCRCCFRAKRYIFS